MAVPTSRYDRTGDSDVIVIRNRLLNASKFPEAGSDGVKCRNSKTMRWAKCQTDLFIRQQIIISGTVMLFGDS